MLTSSFFCFSCSALSRLLSLLIARLLSREALIIASTCSKSKEFLLINFVFVFFVLVIVSFLFLVSTKCSLALATRNQLTSNRSILLSISFAIDLEALKLSR